MPYFMLALAASVVLPVAAYGDSRILAIATEGHNIHPRIAYSPVSDAFVVVWVSTPDAAVYGSTRVNAAYLKMNKQIRVKRTFRVSRTSPVKRQAPFVALAYHPKPDQFLIVWQEITRNGKNLFLNTLDAYANPIVQAKSLEHLGGTLLAPPLLGIEEGSGKALAVWNELTQDGIKTFALPFDPLDPRIRKARRYEIRWEGNKFELNRALTPAGSFFRLLSCFIDAQKGRAVRITSRKISLVSGPKDTSHRLTRKVVRRTLSVSAAPSPGGDAGGETIVVFHRTLHDFKWSVLSSLLLNERNRVGFGPTVLTSKSRLVLETVAIPAADGGFVTAIWLHRSEGIYSLMLAELADDGTLIGEPREIHSSTRPISGPAAALGPDGTRMLVVWSEDSADGSVRVLAKAVDVP